jgi:sugar phosphate isomerase/epimerase
MQPFAISCRPSSYGKYHEQAFSHLAKAGVRYVEIAPPPPDRADDIAGRLKEYGLKPATVALPDGLVGKDDRNDAFLGCAAFADRWDAKIFFASVSSTALGRETTLRRLRELGDIASERGMTIAMETHPDLVTNGDVALQTMRDLNHPHVRVNFDTANVYYYNHDVDAVAELGKIVDYVASMHIKDTGGGFESWDFPGIGEGVVDFPAALRLLRDHGFQGPLTLEIEGVKGEDLSETEAADRVARSVDNLRGWLRELGVDGE